MSTSQQTPDETPFPFKLLGYTSAGLYLYQGPSRCVTKLKPADHTLLNLLELAPLEFWHARWPRSGFDELQAASDLMHMQLRIGPYDSQRQA